MLENALDDASADPMLQARIHIEIARIWALPNLSYAAEHAEAGLAIARRISDPSLIGDALVQKICLAFYRGKGLDTQLGKEALRLDQEGWRPSRAAMALGVCLKQSDRFDEARHWFDRRCRPPVKRVTEARCPV